MIAYLFQSHNHLEDESLAFEQRFVVCCRYSFYFVHGSFQGLFVESGLFRFERCIYIKFYLVRQVGNDILVCLHPSHHVRSCHFSEALGTIDVIPKLDRVRIVFLEGFKRIQIAFVGIIHYAPEFCKPVFYRSTTQSYVSCGRN